MQGSRIAKHSSTLMKQLILLSFFFISLNLLARQIEETTFSYWDKPDSQIYYSIPESIDENTKIIFIMHGASRGAEKYLNDWLPLVKNRNAVLIAPEFSKESYPEYVYLMMSTERGKLLKDQSLYLTDSLGLFFDYFKAKLKLSTSTFRLYGHSGGSQFVHRYLLMSDMPKIKKAVVANAGWYTFLGGWKFPYGIKETPSKLSSDNLRRFLKMKLSVFIGSKDTEITSSVNQSKGANKQGANRFQRANNFFISSSDVAKKHDLEFNWNYKIIKGVGHSNSKMSLAAAEVLLADSTYEE